MYILSYFYVRQGGLSILSSQVTITVAIVIAVDTRKKENILPTPHLQDLPSKSHMCEFCKSEIASSLKRLLVINSLNASDPFFVISVPCGHDSVKIEVL